MFSSEGSGFRVQLLGFYMTDLVDQGLGGLRCISSITACMCAQHPKLSPSTDNISDPYSKYNRGVHHYLSDFFWGGFLTISVV